MELEIVANAVPWLLRTAGLYLIAWALIVALEVALPMGERQSLASRLKAGVLWAIFLPIASLLTASAMVLWAHLGLKPLVTVPLGWAWVLGPILAALIADFFQYWYHRAMHAWFWPAHAVHHSIRELNAVSSYIHPLDEICRLLMITVPTTLLIKMDAWSAAFVPLVLVVYGLYCHSATRLHFGPLRVLFMDNRYHRIHHSTLPEHRDRNFASFFPIWDVVFGTATFPKPGEWPETGVEDRPEAETICGVILAPLKPRPAALGQLARQGRVE